MKAANLMLDVACVTTERDQEIQATMGDWAEKMIKESKDMEDVLNDMCVTEAADSRGHFAGDYEKDRSHP